MSSLTIMPLWSRLLQIGLSSERGCESGALGFGTAQHGFVGRCIWGPGHRHWETNSMPYFCEAKAAASLSGKHRNAEAGSGMPLVCQ